MSCSLIEAKFQVLDRTIKLLSKSNNQRTPSEQLRELVDSQKPTALLPTIKRVKGVVVTRSNHTRPGTRRENQSHPQTSREEVKPRDLRLRPSTGRAWNENSSTEGVQEKWIDPKQRRAEQLLQDTWQEIASAVNWERTTDPLGREGMMKALQSKLLDKIVLDERLESDSTSNQTQPHDVLENNQAHEGIDDLGSAVHDALPLPKRPMTSGGLRSKRSKGYLSVRCQSASSNNSDHQPKNWFAPSTITANDIPRRSPTTKNKNCRPRPNTTGSKRTKPQELMEKAACSNAAEEIVVQRHLCELEVTAEPAKSTPPALPKAEDPSFYMLELRLVHPEPLKEWRFEASFTDISVSPAKAVILNDLMVDRDNCLLFETRQPAQKSSSSRLFNPFLYFPGLNRPSDLYGHVLCIIVTSTRPVRRVVINTTVQFTRFPDESVVEPPPDAPCNHTEVSISQQRTLNSTHDTPRTSSTSHEKAVRKVVVRPSSSSMVKKKKLVKAKPRVKSATKKALSQKDNNHGDSTASLARDQCSPWTSGDQDEPTMDPINYRLEQVLALNALQLGEPRSSSPTTSPQEKATATPLTQTGPTIDHVQSPPRQPLATIDKKKMQLHRLRANIRREMREEKSSTTDTNYV